MPFMLASTRLCSNINSIYPARRNLYGRHIMVIITRQKARPFSWVPEGPQHRLLLLFGKSRQSKMVWHIFDLGIIPWKNMAVGRSNFWTISLSLDRKRVSLFRMAKCLTCSSTISIFSAITVQVRLHFITLSHMTLTS
ncbi:hypothetical protein J007_06583 [Cryptococcus neoformans]|nr:hypothetical protein J007_06583 [Cryptococcus neoformans var. grubii]OXC57899.1 hypothetical protein C358_06679 [Cryptococcus neoformans var. grubii MW-RSA852]